MSAITVSTREAATALGVSVRTVQRRAQQGKLTAAKHGGRWAIRVDVDLSIFKPDQVDKAREAVEQRAILRTSRPGMYAAVSSDGSTTYLTHAAGCSCRAGQRGIRCWHRAAVAILAGVERRAA
ncbi:helix-turn-helix domain-containing protein [Nonomuraea angiospora]|uniref:helix-turn-helix domain-containing protein n=1 Tax=Nonomuraea angiospora TaxID=46172 RepID=UPI0033FC68BA